jgi:tRNA threonylcarbamoyladenosine biosynthesis protein TsaE
MNKDDTLSWQTDLNTLDETNDLAVSLGQRLKGGEIIELVGDMGSGKTTLVRGIVSGAGSQDHVSSPSFTISNQYTAQDFVIYHFDFHRLNEPGIMRDELAEIMKDPSAVVIIEWADIVEDLLPRDRLTIKITPLGENSRRMNFEATDKYSELIPES